MSCIDIIVVKQPDGSFKSSPFFVRFNRGNRSHQIQLVKVFLGRGSSASVVERDSHVQNDPSSLLQDLKAMDARQQTIAHKPVSLSSNDDGSGEPIQEAQEETPPVSSVESHEMEEQGTDVFSSLIYREIKQKQGLLVIEKGQRYPRFMTMEKFDDLRGRNQGSEHLIRSPTSAQTPTSAHNSDLGSIGGSTGGGSSSVDSPSSNSFWNRLSLSGSSKSSTLSTSPTSSYSTVTPMTPSNSSGGYDVSSPTTPSTPATPSTPTTWSERWLDSIERETYEYAVVTPDSNFISQMNLTEEITPISFEFNGERVDGRVFFWNHDSKVVISDVDGTITKSDVRGHIFTRLGMDYAQPGVASVLTNFTVRGYKIMYLTARSIGLFATTRNYLESVRQGGLALPMGPVITAPNKTSSSLVREVIIKRPDVFKVSILDCIKSVFPGNPYVAGWGNRPTDDLSYAKVGVNIDRIFRVNKKGNVSIESCKKFFNSHAHFEEMMEKHNWFPHVTELMSGLCSPVAEVHEILKTRSSVRELVLDAIPLEISEQKEINTGPADTQDTTPES